MTREDVQKIFGVNETIELPNDSQVSVDIFLDIAGFSKAPDNPSKSDLQAIDNGTKGYAELIESGDYS